MPVAALALLGAALWLPASHRASRGQLDLLGAVTAVCSLVAVAKGLGNAETHGWSSAATVAPVCIGLALLLVFVLVERRAENPLLPFRVVRDRNRVPAPT